MRYTFSILLLAAIFIGCKKDKFTTAPKITYKETKQDIYLRGTTDEKDFPILVLSATDAEGDLGFMIGVDTSFVYIKNTKSIKVDSLRFPNVSRISSKNFEIDFEINTKPFIVPANTTKRDTILYEVYIKDFAGNKSNVVISKPIYYIP